MVANQAVIVVVRAIREENLPTEPLTRRSSPEETHRPR